MNFSTNQTANPAKRFLCRWCGNYFVLRGKKLTQAKMKLKRSIHYKGPFCSKECSAKHNYWKLYSHLGQLPLPFEGIYEL